MVDLANLIENESKIALENNWEGYLTPRIELEVNEQEIADNIKKSIYDLNCTCHLKRFIPDRRKPYIRITILGFKRCQKLLLAIKDGFKEDKFIKKIDLLLKYFEYRLTVESNCKRTNEDYTIVNQLKQLS